MLKIKDNFNLKELEKFGYFVSHVAVFPKKIVKQVVLLSYFQDYKNNSI